MIVLAGKTKNFFPYIGRGRCFYLP
jgi:hypothetical protein